MWAKRLGSGSLGLVTDFGRYALCFASGSLAFSLVSVLMEAGDEDDSPVAWFIISLTLALVAIAFAAVFQVTRRRLVETRAKLRTAEKQAAVILNFNESTFEGKSELLEAALNHMNQGIAVVRPDGKVWIYNKQALSYSGVTEDDFTFPPSTRDIARAQLRNGECGPNGELVPEEVRSFFLTGNGRPPRSYMRRRPDGTILEIRSDPMPGGSVIQTYTDVTELVHAKEAAEAAVRAKASFLATMSHEIRTPLNGVIGASALLQESQLTTQQRVYADTITSCGESLLVVINDILDFSKFESVGVTLDEAPCAPTEILRSAMLVTRAAASAKGLAMALDGGDALPPGIIADTKRLRQVLINLLGNAVKFTERGTVTVTARMLTTGNDEWIRVSVRDTGIGIPESARDRLFREFSQVDNTIDRRFGGTGLGLAICKKIIDAMGGRIGVDSEPGVGSDFWFVIPCRRANFASAEPHVRSAPRLAPRTLRLLLAEDIPTNQLVIGATLRALGHQVEIANDGAEALAMVQQATFDAVFLDMQMPVMDGLTATRRIRELGGRYSTLPIIALTANAFASDREACLDAGMNEFLSKPIKKDDAQNVLERLVADNAGASAPPAVAAPAIVDAEQLRILIEAVGFAEATLIADVFEQDTSVLLEDLVPAIREGRVNTSRDLLLSIAAAFAAIGGANGARQARQLMHTLLEADAPDADVALAAVKGITAQLLACVAEIRQIISTTSASQRDGAKRPVNEMPLQSRAAA